MQYALLIYGNEAAAEEAPAAAKEAMMKEFDVFTASILKAGKFRGGEAFQPTATATTVRLSKERVIATDGPFAKTREQLGGFYLVEARNLDEAMEIAGRIPAVRYGSAVEIRPVLAIPRSDETTVPSTALRGKSRPTGARA
ncbi:MAG: YciI family protein [Polyangiaceae bacterium]